MAYKPLEIDGVRYVAALEYARKYGLDKRKIAPACRTGALISRRIMIGQDQGSAQSYRWFVLDKPPEDHPDYIAYAKVRKNALRSTGAIDEEAFDKRSKELHVTFITNWVKRGDAASYFDLRTLASMLGVSPEAVRRWTEIGVDGYGKLPTVKIEGIEDTPGQADTVYHQQDVVRFLKKQLSAPSSIRRTLDDGLRVTNIEQIKDESGFYVYNPEKCYDFNFYGFMKWCADNIRIRNKPFKPATRQIELYKRAFEYKNKTDLRYRCICICRPRGDYKSFDACLLFLFRFFNLPQEKIFLIANSVRQTTHLLFEEAKTIIQRSPKLSLTPGLEFQKEGIYLNSGKNERFNKIEIMSSEAGTRSNATCFAFSEIYKLDNERAFAEIDGSIRAVHNAWTIIESTVAPKGHVFHRLYESYVKNEDPVLFFQYYSDEAGYMNPNTTPEQLKHYRTTFLPGEFQMFFRNRWEDASSGLFDDAKVLEMGYVGYDGINFIQSRAIADACLRLAEIDRVLARGEGDGMELMSERKDIASHLIPVNTLYQTPATYEDLDRLTQIFGCEFILGVGIDRAKQMARRSDRTVMSLVAKGILSETAWIGFVLDVFVPRISNFEVLTDKISAWAREFGWIDFMDIEEYMGKDIYDWAVGKGHTAELVSPTYKHQMEMFNIVWSQMEQGMIKCPELPVWADNLDNVHFGPAPRGAQDILRAEMGAFVHYPTREGGRTGWFGSEYKFRGRPKVGDPKDDAVFAFTHAIYAANRGEMAARRSKDMPFSAGVLNKEVYGDYGKTQVARLGNDPDGVMLSAFGRLVGGF